jgi:hypothetical protein
MFTFNGAGVAGFDTALIFVVHNLHPLIVQTSPGIAGAPVHAVERADPRGVSLEITLGHLPTKVDWGDDLRQAAPERRVHVRRVHPDTAPRVTMQEELDAT